MRMTSSCQTSVTVRRTQHRKCRVVVVVSTHLCIEGVHGDDGAKDFLRGRTAG